MPSPGGRWIRSAFLVACMAILGGAVAGCGGSDGLCATQVGPSGPAVS